MDRLSELGTARGFAERRVERAQAELTAARQELGQRAGEYIDYLKLHPDEDPCRCWIEQSPDCPVHGTVKQRHLADGLQVAKPVQPEMDALREVLEVRHAHTLTTNVVPRDVDDALAVAARAVLTVYDEQVAAMERARHFHVNEAMLRKLGEG